MQTQTFILDAINRD